MGKLELYEVFWEKHAGGKGAFTMNGQGERLGDKQPLIQNQWLQDFKQVADEEKVEGWMDFVSPGATYNENVDNLRNANIPLGKRSSSRYDMEDVAEQKAQREKEQERRRMLEQSEEGHAHFPPKDHWGDDAGGTEFVVFDEEEDDW